MQEETMWLATARTQEVLRRAEQDRLARAVRRSAPRRSWRDRIARHH